MKLKSLPPLAVALSIALAPVAAFAESSIPPEKQAAVTEMLVAQGYEVRKLDMEDGMIEAYALKDGQRYEIYVDDAMKIVEIKKES